MSKLILEIDNDLKQQIVSYTESNNISTSEVTERLWVDFLKKSELEKQLDYYRDCFDKLNRAYSKNLGYAPHKPILLMSIIKLFENKYYTSSDLKITLALEIMFKSEWKKYVTDNPNMNLAQPFYHVKNEPFWQLHLYQYHADFDNKNKMKTLSNLKKIVSHATIDKALTVLLLNEQSRTTLYEFLVWRYFDNHQSMNEYDDLLSKLKHNLDSKFTQFRVILNDLWLPKVA